MSAPLPYMTSSGSIPKILSKIQEARKPDRFTQDFLETKLGHRGGSARPIIPLLKRIGMLTSSGEPTELYTKFRNPNTQGWAMAQAMRKGYHELFERNEYAQDLPKDKLRNLIIEITGLEHDNAIVRSVVATFEALKEYANFDETDQEVSRDVASQVSEELVRDQVELVKRETSATTSGGVGVNLAYTINLNLPETENIRVFDAIFKSLKEHLLE